METINIDVQKREAFGKESVKKIRAKGLIPIEVYGTDLKENISLVTNDKVISNHLFNGVKSRNTIFSFDIDGKKIQAIPCQVQIHPIDRNILHLDMKTVNEKEKVKVRLKLNLLGTAIGAQKGGKLSQKISTVHVKILPQEIPNEIVVDISKMDIGDSLYVKDLPRPASTEILDYSADQTVVIIRP